MLRTIGFSVLTQVVASGGTFAVNVIMLRVLSLEQFGLFVLLYLFATFCAAIVNGACGNVYHLLRPALELQKRTYELNYNALHLAVITAATAIGVTGCLFLSPQIVQEVGFAVSGLFVLSVTAIESLKFQTTANGRHKLIFFVELIRQATLVALFAGMAVRGDTRLLDFVLAHALTGLVACGSIMIGIDWRLSCRRLGWVARRHFEYARYLVPSGLLAVLHHSIVWLILAHWFGPASLGLLRAAELPFNVLNPLKSSLGYFLPRTIFEFDKSSVDRKNKLLFVGLIAFLLLALGCAFLWVGSIVTYPFLIKKEYPAFVGVFFGLAYLFYTSITVTEVYLNIANRSDLVFRQNIFGALASLLTFFAAAPLFGYVSGALAVCGSALVMALYGIFRITQSDLTRDRSVRGAGRLTSP